ncbi:MAG TPA: thioredoxin family protein [Flavobacteriales bacterium]|jgi:thioredoxin-related protein|nr:thioredoxin family protein [Flavobacteriales bacterium]
MKKMFLVLAILAGQLFYAQESHEDLHWLTDFNQAKAIAQKEHKPIVMLFTGSDWCPPCKAMHKDLFPNKDFQKVAKQVVLVLVDFPRRKPISDEQRQKNYELADRYHRGGVPTFVAVTPDGKKVLDKISGYRYGYPDADINFFKEVVRKYKK